MTSAGQLHAPLISPAAGARGMDTVYLSPSSSKAQAGV
jgi:hypothetical protein